MAALHTCPKCGALVSPQLQRCRRCQTYLHGSRIEGAILGLLPAQYAGAPATALIAGAILLCYAMMVALAGKGSVIGFSAFSLRAFGGLHGPSLLLGEHFRYVTYLFGHHDLVHLAFNLSALTSAGPIVERIYGGKKTFLMYLGSGVAAGLGSLVYYVFLRGGDHTLFVSAGASGAVCGMIGAALIGSRRQGREGKEVADRMLRWSFMMVLWGFAVPEINNAAHLSGFLVGAGAAQVVALGPSRSVALLRAQLGAVLGSVALILVCEGLVASHLRGFPVALEKDEQSRSILGIKYYTGVDAEESDQREIWNACMNAHLDADSTEDLTHACELNLRANGHDGRSYTELARWVEKHGDPARAEALRAVATRF